MIKLLPEFPSITQIRETTKDYDEIFLSVMELIADRYEANPDYNWIDTKFSPTTGKDYSDDDMIRGRKIVFGWIQGRALEALVGHSKYFKNNLKNSRAEKLQSRLRPIIKEILCRLQKM